MGVVSLFLEHQLWCINKHITIDARATNIGKEQFKGLCCTLQTLLHSTDIVALKFQRGLIFCHF